MNIIFCLKVRETAFCRSILFIYVYVDKGHHLKLCGIDTREPTVNKNQSGGERRRRQAINLREFSVTRTHLSCSDAFPSSASYFEVNKLINIYYISNNKGNLLTSRPRLSSRPRPSSCCWRWRRPRRRRSRTGLCCCTSDSPRILLPASLTSWGRPSRRRRRRRRRRKIGARSPDAGGAGK